jgi:hypothetical protein
MPNKQNQFLKSIMKRFFTLSFLLLAFSLFGQNLIPDPSAEDFVECPSSLGNIDVYTSSWQSFRGSPDYWHSCSENPLLGWDNSLGFQEPRTGEGYLGLVTFSRNLNNVREYLGISLGEPLTVGQEYFLTFFVSRAHKSNAYNLASNNIGVIMMTENFLNTEELGPTPNYSSFHRTDLITDTVNWVNISYQFIADSAYQFLAFGNFFEDSLTDTLRIGGEPTGSVISYYYFDDFCLSTSPDECDFIISTDYLNFDSHLLKMWPNPCANNLNIKLSVPIQEIAIFSMEGKLIKSIVGDGKQTLDLNIDFESGMYLAVLKTKNGIIKKRFMVSL